jgi:predicted negative regulator of RcsB-dependent stress response
MRILFFLIILLLPLEAWAQHVLGVRASDNNGYSRLVLEADKKLPYSVKKEGDRVRVTFQEDVRIDPKSFETRNIGAINQEGDKDLIVDISNGAKVRSFIIGKRIIIDVYDSDSEPARKVTESKAAEKPQDSPQAETPEMPKEELPPVERVGLSGLQPHVVTLTATENVGMAAFERAGFVWLVFDRPDLTMPPVISGPDKEEFGELEKFDLPNATAYRLQKKPDIYYYGEGGGLLWRLVMTPNPRRVNPTKPTIQDIERNIVWPFKSPRKVITIKDPIVGDDINVVTVLDSNQFSGPFRSYVELDILPSSIGLAFVPKAEDVTASIAVAGVTITRPQGLALSPSRDTASVALKDDIQKENEFFDAEEKKQRLSRIFDFERWQMGGQKSLERNRQILMRGVGNKEGAGKVEDLLTLAKLNIANDRGQEALGLLRVAEQELPGIEENNEFISLHGAAAALAGKFDEAIEKFFDKKLDAYGEIGYWKSFTLAGLEDWRQARRVMPNDLDLLQKYPNQIKEPITLALAEVALRAAEPDRAQKLLETLEESFPEMSLPRQSAWKYLNGELERQKNNPDKALENWKTLLDGKDDYHRAKAGLSVTKMQLERQKITPQKAIDRLEGLRYAWRGDELETLINYRLGKVYIDNENYLKGLSTLRSAVSLSPDSKITEEVTDYMTDTFRSLFTEGKLSSVSALDAVSIYDEFKELTPIGEEGDMFVKKLAERLVDVDLLGRAAYILDHQLNHRAQGDERIKVAIRLAAIQLLDNKPEEALTSLNIAEDGNTTSSQKREITLLKARALSKTGNPSDGLRLLRPYRNDLDVMRLRADIAWNASRWSDAASAFKDLIEAEDISQTRPMNDYQVSLVLNRAIALNLSGNRTALSTHKNIYGDLMRQSERARLFDLVTRDRQIGLGGNEEAVSSLISEVDLFGEFLENYKTIN